MYGCLYGPPNHFMRDFALVNQDEPQLLIVALLTHVSLDTQFLGGIAPSCCRIYRDKAEQNSLVFTVVVLWGVEKPRRPKLQPQRKRAIINVAGFSTEAWIDLCIQYSALVRRLQPLRRRNRNSVQRLSRTVSTSQTVMVSLCSRMYSTNGGSDQTVPNMLTAPSPHRCPSRWSFLLSHKCKVTTGSGHVQCRLTLAVRSMCIGMTDFNQIWH
jgi:hypothetical protein